MEYVSRRPCQLCGDECLSRYAYPGQCTREWYDVKPRAIRTRLAWMIDERVLETDALPMLVRSVTLCFLVHLTLFSFLH